MRILQQSPKGFSESEEKEIVPPVIATVDKCLGPHEICVGFYTTDIMTGTERFRVNCKCDCHNNNNTTHNAQRTKEEGW